MPCWIKVKIKNSTRAIEDIEKDSTELLGAIAARPFIQDCPHGMFIQLYYNRTTFGGATLIFSFSHVLIDSDDKAQRFKILIDDCIKNKGLSAEYTTTNVIPGIITDLPTPTDKNGPQPGFLCETTLYPHQKPSQEVLKKSQIPGISFLFNRRIERGHFESTKLYSDAQALTQHLVASPIVYPNRRLKPVWLKDDITSQCFELVIPGILFPNTPTHYMALSKLASDKLLEKSMEKDYYVSCTTFSTDIMNHVTVRTKNSEVLEQVQHADEQIPEGFLCSLTSQIMDKPVQLPNGPYVDEFVLQFAHSQEPVNPYTKQPLDLKSLTPDKKLENEIHGWVKKQFVTSTLKLVGRFGPATTTLVAEYLGSDTDSTNESSNQEVPKLLLKK